MDIEIQMDFFYPNLQNDMWRIFGIIFFGDREHFISNGKFDSAKIMDFCEIRVLHYMIQQQPLED